MDTSLSHSMAYAGKFACYHYSTLPGNSCLTNIVFLAVQSGMELVLVEGQDQLPALIRSI